MELFRLFASVASCSSDENYYSVKCRAEEYQRKWNKVKHDVFKIWTNKDKSLLEFCID